MSRVIQSHSNLLKLYLRIPCLVKAYSKQVPFHFESKGLKYKSGRSKSTTFRQSLSKNYLDLGISSTGKRPEGSEISWYNYNFSTMKDASPQTYLKASEKKSILDKYGDKVDREVLSINPDLSNRGYLVRLEEQSKVFLGFIPQEWLDFFENKTGKTGFLTLIFTLSSFLITKEYYVLEHNFFGGISAFTLVWMADKYIGPKLSKTLDKDIQEYERKLKESLKKDMVAIEELIIDEDFYQYQIDGQLIVIKAKREIVHFQREAEYRNRMMLVYRTVIHRLDYHVDRSRVLAVIHHKNMHDWVNKEIKKALTEDFLKQYDSYIVDHAFKYLLVEIYQTSQLDLDKFDQNLQKKYAKKDSLIKTDPQDPKGKIPPIKPKKDETVE